MKRLEELKKENLQKIEELREQGKRPFGKRFERNTTAEEILKKFEKLEKGKHSKKEDLILAGRVKSLREHGKLAFLDIEDFTAQVQVCAEKETLGKNFQIISYLAEGDIVGVTGHGYKSNRGEISVWADELDILCKAVRPLPPEMKDPETRYRQRYADLAVNPDKRNLFKKRAKIISEMRKFLEKKNFIELETPTLQPIYGGALAEPFETYHNQLKRKTYLRISPELYLKRMIVGGFEKVFEICKNFRNEGTDTKHNPEFTMMELYWAYADYNDNMELTEKLIYHIAKKVNDKTKIKYGNEEIDLTPPWPRLTMHEAIEKYLDVEIVGKNKKQLEKIAKEKGIDIPKYADKGIIIAELFDAVESKIIQPTFIIDFPVEVSPLAKAKKDQPELTERFELIIAGQEFANAYTELNDPVEQADRFSEQKKLRKAGDKEAHETDQDFIRALEYGMAPTSGLGIGVDRLVMLLTNQESIREVIMFPVLKKGG